MDNLINREAALAAVADAIADGRNVYRALADVPTVDAVPVVRCRGCKHRYYYENDAAKPVCTKSMAYCNTPDDWFCADGERKGGDE